MNRKAYEGMSTGIILIGLGLLWLLPGVGFWPGILVVIGLAGLPASLATQRGWMGWQGAFWMIGIALLFWTGLFWPGILILVGVSTLLGGLTRSQPGSPWEARRAAPEPVQGTRRLNDAPVRSGDTDRLRELDEVPFDVDEPAMPEPPRDDQER